MSREIKFRAIHKLTKKKWYEEDLIFHNGEWYEDWRAFEDFRPLNMKQCAVMQYTGLKDKDGVDIYEGDIIDYFKDEPTTVQYVNDLGSYAFVGYVSGDMDLTSRILGEFEVIGSIYENPELLEESAE